MDEKGFRQGISDSAKIICLRHGLRMNWQQMEIEKSLHKETSGEGVVLPTLIIYQGAGHYVGWYQSLKNPEIDCDQWSFSYSKKIS